MRAFACDHCGQLVFFENTACLACGSALGYVPGAGLLTLVEDVTRWGSFLRMLPTDDASASERWVRCANADLTLCNWMVPVEDAGDRCRNCDLTRTIPNLDDPEAVAALAVTETAKRRLVFQLDSLHLPIVSRSVDGHTGLAFDLLSSRFAPVTTGHADGVITIDLAESDDVHREWLRRTMGESYRTMLGHLRHEIGHYYWMVLARDPATLERIRELFGDDTLNYQDALDRHYGHGPAGGWEEHHVSAYAAMHPWEDWAETFAHYLHIRGTLQTAAAYDVVVGGPRSLGRQFAGAFRSDPARVEGVGTFAALLDDWLPLTYALNEINRAMGKRPLYPFVLRPAVLDKLDLVHQLCQQLAER